MGDVVNLRLARKAQRRAAEDQAASANRATFGRTKAERAHSSAEQRLRERQLDLHRREDG